MSTKNPRPTSRSFRVEAVGRGHANNTRNHNREFGPFVIALAEVFTFREDWHRDDRAKPIVQQYQVALDSVLESHPHLRACVACCGHCGIRFLSHPRNAGRQDLRCPFGCRRHERRRRSSQRSTAYYRTPSGKAKKKRIASRRRAATMCATGNPSAEPAPPSQEEQCSTAGMPSRLELRLADVVLEVPSLLHSPILSYLRMIVGLIEGIRPGHAELAEQLQRAMRQHSIAYRLRRDYVLDFLSRHPP